MILDFECDTDSGTETHDKRTLIKRALIKRTLIKISHKRLNETVHSVQLDQGQTESITPCLTQDKNFYLIYVYALQHILASLCSRHQIEKLCIF